MGKRPAARVRSEKRSAKLIEPNWEDPARYVTLDLRSSLLVLAKEQKKRSFAETYKLLSGISQRNPGLVMRIPAQVLLAFASCASTTGTAAASITPDVSVMAGRVVVAFTYTDASTAGCQLNGIKSIDFVDDSGTKHANLEELQHTPIGAAGATGSYFGKTKSGVPAAAVGTSVTVNVTFNVKETLWCHTCTPSPVTASAKATVK